LAQSLRNARYTSRIIKAGALLPDTKLLLVNWDEDIDVRANLDRVRQENLFGKASRSRIEDILLVFRQRYLKNPEVLSALVIMARNRMPSESLDRILYFQAARSDPLLHDLVIELLNEWLGRSDREVRPWEVQNWIEQQVASGKIERHWSPPVQRRVVQGLLSALRDFGILEGSVKKRLAYVYLPLEAFAFIAFQLHTEGRSGKALLHAPEWELFLPPEGAVERLFLEAHQEGLLQYHAAGPVVRIDFPAHDLEGYALVLSRHEH
jgi:Putative inner membrane protein (DUF1819)